MKYKSEASINKLLAELQLAGTSALEETTEEDTFESLLRSAIQSENEAVKIYLRLIAKSEEIGSNVLVKAFDEIKNDEEIHIGNLNYLVKLLCSEAAEKEQEGEKEEAQLQAGIESED